MYTVLFKRQRSESQECVSTLKSLNAALFPLKSKAEHLYTGRGWNQVSPTCHWEGMGTSNAFFGDWLHSLGQDGCSGEWRGD